MSSPLDRAIDRLSKRGVRLGEARLVEKDVQWMRVRNGRLALHTRTVNRGVGVRALHGGWGFAASRDPETAAHVADRAEVKRLDNHHLSWAKDETHTDDPETFLPLTRLDEAAAAGRIGSVSDRFYCLPTQYSHRKTQRHDTPQIIEWLREDDVDVVLMVPL